MIGYQSDYSAIRLFKMKFPTFTIFEVFLEHIKRQKQVEIKVSTTFYKNIKNVFCCLSFEKFARIYTTLFTWLIPGRKEDKEQIIIFVLFYLF